MICFLDVTLDDFGFVIINIIIFLNKQLSALVWHSCSIFFLFCIHPSICFDLLIVHQLKYYVQCCGLVRLVYHSWGINSYICMYYKLTVIAATFLPIFVQTSIAILHAQNMLNLNNCLVYMFTYVCIKNKVPNVNFV